MEEHQEGSELINSDKGLKNMKTLYVTDLDGTLMRNDMTISEESVRMLNQLIDKGVFITYATARSFHSAYEITKDIHFKVPVITRNGTTFADNENAKELETAYFPVEVLSELKEKLPIIENTGFTSVYINGEMFKVYLEGPKSKEFQGYIDYYKSIGDKRLLEVDDFEKLFAFSLSPQSEAELAAAAEGYAVSSIGYRMKTLDFYHKILTT